jgi:hypothetical protein
LRPTLVKNRIIDPADDWDLRAAAVPREDRREGELLAELGRRYLVERGDQALGLAPTRLLRPGAARTWLLFWTAARRVDDDVESGRRPVDHWRAGLGQRVGPSLAERCLGAFLTDPHGVGTRAELLRTVRRGLDGLAREQSFTRPRPLSEYLDLIHDKSATAMWVLDRLLFPGEATQAVRLHAEAFAASTQVGDDCRDVRRDLAAGRCFVAREEIAITGSLDAHVASPAFATIRRAMCDTLLDAADGAAARFRSPQHRATAVRLSALWRGALRSAQIAPTDRRLRFAAKAPPSGPPATTLPPALLLPLKARFAGAVVSEPGRVT